MLGLGNPKINFQYESPKTLDRLVELVKLYLPEEEENDNENDEEGQETEQNQSAFQVTYRLYNVYLNR